MEYRPSRLFNTIAAVNTAIPAHQSRLVIVISALSCRHASTQGGCSAHQLPEMTDWYNDSFTRPRVRATSRHTTGEVPKWS
jgi:hypothetical protein